MVHIDLKAEQFEKIIIRMPNWIGDLIMATPLIKDLRHFFKNAEITAMCQSNVAPLLEKDPNINEILSFKKINGWIQGPRNDIIDPLKFGGFDLGILTTNSFSSAWWFYRGNVKNRIGFKGRFRSWLLTVPLNYPENKEAQHQILTYKKLLEPLGIPVSQTKPYLYLDESEIHRAKALLDRFKVIPKKDILVGINPGAAYGTAKCWLPERFQEVTRKLLTHPDLKIVYFGDMATQELVQKIVDPLDEERVINLAGKTSLREFIALISLMDVFLTNDSGPMHIASALELPVLALFGSTSTIKTGPYGNFKVIQKKVSCSPCYKRVCPIDFRCMTQISSDEVYKSLLEMIRNSNQTLKVI